MRVSAPAPMLALKTQKFFYELSINKPRSSIALRRACLLNDVKLAEIEERSDPAHRHHSAQIGKGHDVRNHPLCEGAVIEWDTFEKNKVRDRWDRSPADIAIKR